MPKISNVVVCQKNDKGDYDVSAPPPEFVKSKFALFLKAYPKNDWDRDKAMEAVGIKPGQLHRWLKKYPEIKKRLDICEEGIKDWGERRLREFMGMDNKVGMVATLFFLKSKCQDRGYVEQIQFQGTVENRYPKEMLDAVANAAKYGNSRSMINVTPSSKRLIEGNE